MLSFSTSCSRMFALWFTSISWCTKQGEAFELLSTRPRSLCLHSNRILPLRASPSEENNETNEDQEPIPQLPAIGCSSFEPTSSDDYCNNDLKDGKKIAYIGGKFEMQYTCKICETRNSNRVSRLAYRTGVVIAICKKCDSKHMIADNLKWTDYEGGFEGDRNIEEYLANRGEEVKRVSQDVFELEKAININIDSGSIVSEDGTSTLE